MTDIGPWEDPRRVLKRHGLVAKASFSQNFLVARSAVERSAALVGDAVQVVELGPGLGTLTFELLRRGCEVIAVDRDRDMLAVLEEESQGHPRLRLQEADASTVRLAELGHPPPLRVVGNIPYSITGAIFRSVVDQADDIDQGVFLIQKEVRDRLVAEPGTKAYGIPTVFAQARFAVRGCFGVSRGSFHPAPRVDSAVVELRKLATPRAEVTADLEAVVHAAFGKRRKPLRTALRSLPIEASTVDAMLEDATIDGRRRGETLAVEEFAALAQAYSRRR